MSRMVPVVFSLGQLGWERPQQLAGALLLASTQLSDPDGGPEEIWLEEGVIFDPISNEGKQRASATVFCPSCHHDECSDHDHVLGFKRHNNGTLITIVTWIWIWIGVQHGNFGLCNHKRLACNRGSGDHIDHENGFENDDNAVHGDNHHVLERAYLKNGQSMSQRADNSLGS